MCSCRSKEDFLLERSWRLFVFLSTRSEHFELRRGVNCLGSLRNACRNCYQHTVARLFLLLLALFSLDFDLNSCPFPLASLPSNLFACIDVCVRPRFLFSLSLSASFFQRFCSVSNSTLARRQRVVVEWYIHVRHHHHHYYYYCRRRSFLCSEDMLRRLQFKDDCRSVYVRVVLWSVRLSQWLIIIWNSELSVRVMFATSCASRLADCSWMTSRLVVVMLLPSLLVPRQYVSSQYLINQLIAADE